LDLTTVAGELAQLQLIIDLIKDDGGIIGLHVTPASPQIQILSTIKNCSAIIAQLNDCRLLCLERFHLLSVAGTMFCSSIWTTFPRMPRRYAVTLHWIWMPPAVSMSSPEHQASRTWLVQPSPGSGEWRPKSVHRAPRHHQCRLYNHHKSGSPAAECSPRSQIHQLLPPRISLLSASQNHKDRPHPLRLT
jgi:hypothetical protein